MPRQLLLPVRLRDIAVFDNFYARQNQELIAQLNAIASNKEHAGRMIYFYGDTGCGKTHLLHAVCRCTSQIELTASYVPLSDPSLSPGMLDGLAVNTMVCLDDVQAIAGNAHWERAIMDLYEQLRQQNGNLIAAGTMPLDKIGLLLADLKSRLASELNYGVVPLDDREKSAALQLRAQSRGFVLSEEVAAYVLNRYPRDTHSLFALLDRLDDLSLAEGRRVTIPLMRKLESATPN